MRNNGSISYSHIQIVTKKPTENRINTDNDEPIFRTPSYLHDIQAATGLTSIPNIQPARSPESLANNTQGTTFAAKARAAELQAARTHKEIKAHSFITSIPASHETMTFKSKGKGSKVWKRLDLSEITASDGTDGGQIQKRDVSDGFSNTNDHSRAQSTDDFHTSNSPRDAAKEPIFSEVSDLLLPSRSTKSNDGFGDDKNLSPESLKLANSVERYDADQWDPDPLSPSVEMSDRPKELNPAAIVLKPPKLDPVPVLTSCPSGIVKQSTQLQQNAEGQFASGQQNMRSSISTPCLGSNTAQSREINFGLTDFPTRQIRFEKSDSALEETTAVSDPSKMPPFMFAERLRTTYSQPSAIAPLKSKPPHQYPAVKGTMNDGFKFPPPGLPYPPPSELSPERSSCNPSYFTAELSMAHMPTQPDPSRPSHTERNEMLMQHLENVAENSRVGLETSRSVMHDPFTNDGSKNSSPSRPLVAKQQELRKTSEELPWKSRPVAIMEHHQPIAHQYPSLFDYVMTPKGVITPKGEIVQSHPGVVQPRFDAGHNSPRSDIHTAHQQWWKRDSRFTFDPQSHQTSVQTLYDWLRNGTAEEEQRARALRAGQVETLRRANLFNKRNSIPNDPLRYISREDALELMLPALAILHEYSQQHDYFNRHGEVSEWCIDHGPDGNKSYFEKGWGAPPPRVRRDPRYKSLPFEGVQQSPSPRYYNDAGYSNRGRQLQH